MPVSAGASNVQKLFAKCWVRLVVSPPEGGPRRRLGFADAAHLGPEMNRLEVHGDAMGLQDAREGPRDLATTRVLDGEPPGEEAHQAGELGDADDVLVGDVAEVGVAEKRKGVVLAERVKGDRAFHYLTEIAVGTAIAFRREGGDQLVIALIALRGIEHRAQVAHGGPGRAGGVERQTHQLKDLPDVTPEPLPLPVTPIAPRRA